MNEYANSEAVMYAVRQAENESTKRRKMLALNPYDGEEVNDSKDKLKMFRMRKSEDRPMYKYSIWGRMLRNPRTRDPGDRKRGVLFRLRFRVPFPLFERIVALTRENNWFMERGDSSRRKGAPLELKIEIEGSDAVGNILLNVGVLCPQADSIMLIIHVDSCIHIFTRSEVFVFGQKANGGRLNEG